MPTSKYRDNGLKSKPIQVTTKAQHVGMVKLPNNFNILQLAVKNIIARSTFSAFEANITRTRTPQDDKKQGRGFP